MMNGRIKRALATTLIPLASLLAVSLSAVPQPQDQGLKSSRATISYPIRGRVIDAITKEPLADVEVGATLDAPLERSLSALTASDGRFTLNATIPGKYLVQASRSGYVTQNYQQHETFYTRIVIGPGVAPVDALFELRPGAVIYGQVTDDFGDPVRGAQVMLFRETIVNGRSIMNAQGQRGPDDEGRYHFSGLPAGKYFIAVHAEPWYNRFAAREDGTPIALSFAGHGASPIVFARPDLKPSAPSKPSPLDVVYPLTFYSSATEQDRASALVLSSGEQATADFHLSAVPSVHLAVKLPFPPSPESNFLIEATLDPFSANRQNLELGPPTLQADTLVIAGLPPQRFLLNIQTENYGGQPLRWQQEIDGASGAEVALDESSLASPIGGRVLLGDKPVPLTSIEVGDSVVTSQASVVISDLATGFGFEGQILPDGTFTVRNLDVRPGTFTISLRGLSAYFVQSIESGSGKPTARTFEYTRKSLTLIIHVATGMGSVEGVAVRNEKPQSGVMILVVPVAQAAEPGSIRRAQSDSDGAFEVSDLAPGAYFIAALENGWNLEWAKPEILKNLLISADKVQVTSNNHCKVKLNSR